ncbi:MAG: DUF1003 domain-containing protein [Clostridium sp.]|nr:DUF1003 domain-containing protein [Clostridium sp.]MDU7082616.1 DUF1003 domain-containing protein [Clostridium sp.]
MKKDKEELLKLIITDVDEELNDEEFIHLLLDNKVSVTAKSQDKDTFGQKLADKIATFAGSWTFIIIFFGTLVLWMMVNGIALKNKGFDPYPFILLNLALSCLAAFQAPLIMMSQNRQEAKDRVRSENDYKVNLKNEVIMSDIHEKLDKLLENQEAIFDKLEKLGIDENTKNNE